MRDGLSLQLSTTTCPFTLLSCANTLLLLLLLLPGGTSLLTQMRERLELDISAAAPGGTKVKVTAPVNPTERRHAVWIGELAVSPLQFWLGSGSNLTSWAPCTVVHSCCCFDVSQPALHWSLRYLMLLRHAFLSVAMQVAASWRRWAPF
jgi:hypothetical protein